ncbi:MAG: hypothetical protein AAFU64_06025 [Bacteroidota bacterium]
MMKNDLKNLENRRIRELAREYQKLGYQVTTEPSPEVLPDFLKAYAPDLLVQKEGENIIVEVKTQKSLPQSEYLEEVAQILEQKDNWKLELVLTNPRKAPEALPLPNMRVIKEKFEKARQLRRMNEPEASFLLKASCLEALMRILFKDEQPRVVLESEPQGYARQLFSYGFLDKSDYLRLRLIAEKIHLLRQGYFGPKSAPKLEDETNLDLILHHLIDEIEGKAPLE